MSKLLPLAELLPRCKRGILFSGPLIPPVLDGRKTVTRRLDQRWLKYPAGTLLYVCETIRRAPETVETYGISGVYRADGAVYASDGTPCPMGAWVWRRDVLPSLHMPRALSRCVLRLTEDPRLERVQEITHLDAVAEGFDWSSVQEFKVDRRRRREDDREDPREVGYPPQPTREHGFARDNFIRAWEALHTKDGERWEDNPLCVRLAFERIA